MSNTAKMTDIPEFCKRWCAVSAGENTEGYFRVRAGPSMRKLAVVSAGVPWAEDLEETTQQCTERVQTAVEDGHKWVVLEAVASGGTRALPSARLRFRGDEDALMEEVDDDDSPRGRNSLQNAHASVVLGLLRANRDLIAENMRLGEERQEMALHAMHQGTRAAALELSDRSRAVAAAIEASQPTLQVVLPMLIQAMANPGQTVEAPAPIPADMPEEPPAAAEWCVSRIQQAAQQLVRVWQSDPSAVTPELVEQLAGMSALVDAFKAQQAAGVGTPPAEPDDAEVVDAAEVA